jgi:hypothetical protein
MVCLPMGAPLDTTEAREPATAGAPLAANAEHAPITDQPLRIGMAALALYHVALAAFMAAAPHAFYTSLGPFGAYNSHYVRDTATFEAALGLGLLIAISRVSWRVPVLAVVTAQFALHTINHLLDVDRAHPAWIGWFDFLALLLATVLLGTLLAQARRPHAHRKQGALP